MNYHIFIISLQIQEETELLIQKQNTVSITPFFYILLSILIVNLCGFISSLGYFIYIKTKQIIAFTFGKAENGNSYIGFFIAFLIMALITSILLYLIKKKNNFVLNKTTQILSGNILIMLTASILIIFICGISIQPEQIVYNYYSTEQGFKLNYYTVKKQSTNVKIDYLNKTIIDYQQNNKQNWHSIDINSTNKCQITIKYNKKHFIQNIELDSQNITHHQFYVTSDTLNNKQLQEQTQNIPMENNFYLYIPIQQQNQQQALINYYNTLLYSNTHYSYVSNCSDNHHQIINGDNFYFINIHQNPDQIYEYLDQQIPKHQGIKYIVTNDVIMSAGPSGINQDISEILISLIDMYSNQQIAAVLQPSDGCLSTFKFSNTYFISVGRGDYQAQINDQNIMGDRIWNNESIQGPIDQLQLSSFYSFHYLSNIYQQYLQVTIDENNQVQFLVNNLATNQEVIDLQSNIKEVFEWGPIMTPYEQGANISWYTKEPSFGYICIDDILYYSDNNLFNTKSVSNCLTKIDDQPLSKYHSVYIPLQQFNFTLNQKNMTFDNTPRKQHKFVVTSDLHEDFFIGRKSQQTMDNFEFNIFAGDFSYLSNDIEYDACYNSFQSPTTLFIPVEGNHDGFANHYQKLINKIDQNYDIKGVERRNTSFYQNVQGLNFFGLFVFNSTFITNESEIIMNQTLEFLEQELPKHEGLKFIVSHRPLYSTGDFGANQTFSERLESIIKKYNDNQTNSSNRIVAMFSGHDHIFSSFYNEDLKIWSFIDASDGGVLSMVQSKIQFKDRAWPGRTLHGDLSDTYGNEGKCYGYNWHVDSYQQFTQTEVEVDEDNRIIYYNIRDLISMQIVYNYTYQY